MAGLTPQSTNEETITASLPPFTEVNKLPDSNHNNLNPEELVNLVDQVYETMITWRKNLFLLPSGNVGKDFIRLLIEWLKKFNVGNSFKGIAKNHPPPAKARSTQKFSANEYSYGERGKSWTCSKIVNKYRKN